MHLIQSLAAGINGGANGSAVLLARGTSTPVTYYQDFEATQPVASTLVGVQLDANGALVAYVNQLVDVRVLDVNGAILREFVAGDSATAVEVISPSFTGVDYVTGASAANKPTTLDQVLALIAGSFGTTNFNVLVNGASVTLQAAVAGLAGLFFNVKSYGAIGDGVADDGASVTAAIAAAALAGAAGANGGIVFFPPGKYRSTTSITVTAGVSLLGTGANCSQILWDNAALANGLILPAGGSIGSVTGLRFDTVNSNFTNPLVLHSGGTWSVLDCLFGGATTTKGKLLTSSLSNLTPTLQLNIERCQFTNNADSPLVTQTGSCRINFSFCTFTLWVGTYTSNAGRAMCVFIDNVNMDSCRFDGSPVTGGSVDYIQYAPNFTGSCAFTRCNFRGNAFITTIALRNTLATATLDCTESGCVFGDPISGLVVVPYAGSTGFYAYGSSLFGSAHGSRNGRVQTFNTNAAAVGASTDQYDMIIVNRTGAGAQNITLIPGRIGERCTLQVVNSSGAGLTIGTVGCVLDTGGATYAVGNGITSVRRFVYSWVAGLASAAWMQESKESLDN